MSIRFILAKLLPALRINYFHSPGAIRIFFEKNLLLSFAAPDSWCKLTCFRGENIAPPIARLPVKYSL
tara:strand:- start:340 stop:543 length:204 start_codon:yes stop_codon:yes gene_type:complete